MGLWSSKQEATRELKVKNESPREIFVTEKVINSITSNLKNESQPTTTTTITPLVPSSSSSSSQDPKQIINEQILADYEEAMLLNFNKTTKEVEKIFGDRYESLPVCLDLQSSISNCYAENLKYPLKCINFANEYIKCVELARKKRLELS
jgi:hypothetical protein